MNLLPICYIGHHHAVYSVRVGFLLCDPFTLFVSVLTSCDPLHSVCRLLAHVISSACLCRPVYCVEREHLDFWFIATLTSPKHTLPFLIIKMAVAPEDDEDLDTNDPRLLKVLRGNAKRRFTNTVKLVRNLMADHGSRTPIRNRRDEIIVANQECDTINSRCSSVCPEDTTSDSWFKNIDDDLDFWLNTVEEHDEKSSDASSLYSQRLPLLTPPSQLRRPSPNPNLHDLRIRVNQLELQGIHGFAGSPSLQIPTRRRRTLRPWRCQTKGSQDNSHYLFTIRRRRVGIHRNGGRLLTVHIFTLPPLLVQCTRYLLLFNRPAQHPFLQAIPCLRLLLLANWLHHFLRSAQRHPR